MQPSDINEDGVVNAIDLSILVSLWGTADSEADLNGDGVVNALDLSVLVGDINGGSQGEYLTVTGVTANGDDGNLPINVIDDNPATRWSHNANPSILNIDLSSVVPVGGIEIEQYYTRDPEGNNAIFDIYTSTDGANWSLVYKGLSDEQGFMTFRWPTTNARYIRYYGMGRESSVWNSVTRIRVLGPTAGVLYAIPPAVTVVPGNESNSIYWQAPRPGPAASEWRIERSLNEGSGYTTIESGITEPYLSSAPYVDSGLTNGTEYFYRVSAINGSGTNPGAVVSGTPTSTTPPPAPGTVSHGTELTREDVGLIGISYDVYNDPFTPIPGFTQSGPITTSSDGQVIENLDIEVSGRDNWAIVINHDNVTVRNCRIQHPNGGQGIYIPSDNTEGALIEHNVLNAVYLSSIRKGHKSSSNSIGQRTTQIRGENHIIRRNHVLFARSCFWVRGSHTVISENYVEPLAHKNGVSPYTGTPNSPGGASTHGTAISNGGGTSYWTAERNVLPQGGSGGIIIYSGDAPHNNLTIRDNWLYGTDQGFGIYGGRTHSRENWNMNYNIKIEGNRFSGTFGYSNTLGRGTNAAVDLSRPGNTFYNNRFIGEDTDLPARCGISQNSCE